MMDKNSSVEKAYIKELQTL